MTEDDLQEYVEELKAENARLKKALRGIQAQCPAPIELIYISPKLTVIRSIATKALEGGKK